MRSLKSLAQGFLAAAGLIWVFNAAMLINDTAALVAGMRYSFLGLIVAVNLAVPLILSRTAQPKHSLNLKNP
jgi:hypothetical protein